jgi:hypothetical protein
MRNQPGEIVFLLLLCLSILYSCKHEDLVCTDANTTRINDYDTIYSTNCQQIIIREPTNILFYETLPSELNYGKPLLKATYAQKTSYYYGVCSKDKIFQSLPFEDFYLENLCTRNYTITYSLGIKTPYDVKLKAGEKRLINKSISGLEAFSFINIEYE